MIDTKLPFANRRDAGRRLAAAVAGLALADPVILALPRGGVPVAYEIARRLHAPLDILIARKIGAPGHEEYGIGAVVDGAAPQLVLDEQAARASGADRAYVEREVGRQLAEIERRRSAYHVGEPVRLAGRNLILVDDGIATGGTVRVALKALASAGARSVTLAVPVAPAAILSELRKMCDRIVCIAVLEPFFAVGAHYRDFSQIEDAEVRALLEHASSGAP
jgi:predicted phosphoribosyltransferase